MLYLTLFHSELFSGFHCHSVTAKFLTNDPGGPSCFDSSPHPATYLSLSFSPFPFVLPTLASLLFLKYTRLSSTSEPLNLLIFLPNAIVLSGLDPDVTFLIRYFLAHLFDVFYSLSCFILFLSTYYHLVYYTFDLLYLVYCRLAL